MENNNTVFKVIIAIIIIIILGLFGWILFKKGVFSKEKTEETIPIVCTAEDDGTYVDNRFKIDTENSTGRVHAIGGSGTEYNVTTTVTKEHNYTKDITNDELYALSDNENSLFVLYEGKLYYTNNKENFSKYCEEKEVQVIPTHTMHKTICDYSKITTDAIKGFKIVNIKDELKSIGSYGNAGSGSPEAYAITTDGRVIKLYSDSCKIMYDDPTRPIERILNLYFYYYEYTVLLKDGTLITKIIDFDNPIKVDY